jgi:hypothetical protein
MRIKTFCCTTLAAGWGFIQAAQAAAPSGVFYYAFNASDAPLWDLTGEYNIQDQIQAKDSPPVPVALNFYVVQDEKGRLRGEGMTAIAIGSDLVAGEYKASGSVKTSGGVTRTQLKLTYKGEGVIAGTPTSYSLKTSYNLEVSPLDARLVGEGKGNASIAKLGKGPMQVSLDQPMPAGMTGAWTLQCSILPLNKLSGGAWLTLANQRSLAYQLTGKYTLSTDQSQVKLKGLGSASGTKLSLKLGGDAAQVLEMDGKVFGQTIKQ